MFVPSASELHKGWGNEVDETEPSASKKKISQIRLKVPEWSSWGHTIPHLTLGWSHISEHNKTMSTWMINRSIYSPLFQFKNVPTALSLAVNKIVSDLLPIKPLNHKQTVTEISRCTCMLMFHRKIKLKTMNLFHLIVIVQSAQGHIKQLTLVIWDLKRGKCTVAIL